MKCPDCGHTSETALLKCGSCGEVFDREGLETLQHIEYLLSWLDGEPAKLSPEAYAKLRFEAAKELARLRDSLKLMPEPLADLAVPTVPPVIPEVRRTPSEIKLEIANLLGVHKLLQSWSHQDQTRTHFGNSLGAHLEESLEAARAELGDLPVDIDPPSPSEVIDYALRSIPAWTALLKLDPEKETTFKMHLRQLRVEQRELAEEAPALAAEVAPPEKVQLEAEAPQPVVSKPPKRPPLTLPKIDWAKLWERTWGLVTSGVALRGLLYLGAFMIVVSTAVLVVRFWDNFPQLVQLLFIASVPTIFYLAGWGVRTRLKLPQAGNVLSGVGALLVAVDFVAVYQFGGLAGQIDRTAYWLGASIICTIIYTVSSIRLPTEFFGYITLIGLGSTLMAFTSFLSIPPEWQIAVMALLAIVIIEGAARLSKMDDRWADLALSGDRFSHILIVASMASAILVRGDVAFGQMFTFLLGAFGFGLLAWHSPHVVYAHAATWSSIGAFAFLFRLIGLPVEWYGVAVGLMVIFYGLAGHGLANQIEEESELEAHILKAVKGEHWALIAISIATGIMALVLDIWAGVISLALSTMLLAWSAYLYQMPNMILAAATLFTAPFSIALLEWFDQLQVTQAGGWLMAGWAGLALTYLGLAAAFRSQEKYVRWLNLLAHAIAPAATLGFLINYVLLFDDWTVGPTFLGLGEIIVLYIASAVIHDSGRFPGISNYLTFVPERIRHTLFHWPAGFLIPVWVAIGWSGSMFKSSWLGVGLGALGLAYVGLGELLARRKVEYRWPPQTYAYLLAPLGILVALGDRWALLTVLYISVAVFVSLAGVYRRVLETALAAVLFIWPFQLSLELSPLTMHAYSLAYALLATFGYIPTGILLDRKNRNFALPLFFVGYALSGIAVVGSLLGRFQVYPIDVPWIGAVTPLLVTGLLVFSAYRFKWFPFSWAAAGVFPIAFGQSLTLFRVPAEYLPLAWVGLAFAYLVIDRVIYRGIKPDGAHWMASFLFPLRIGTAILCALGLGLTVLGTFTIFFGGSGFAHMPLILAQALALGLTVVAARAYHNRWIALLAAALSFFPYTLAWMGYGPALKSGEFAWTWMGLSVVLLVIGYSLDKFKIRYSQSLYLAGYTLAGFAIFWSAQDRLANILTLAASLLIALLSQVVIHRGRHHTFNDWITFIWRTADTTARRIAETVFLYLLAIGFPLLLVQALTHNEISLAWRGLALALAAAIYIALGLGLRGVKETYAWPFFGVGYLLTAIGAMIAIEDQLLAIIVLSINAVIYAVSAYIFRQPFWLYLASVLIPVVALLTLNYNQILTAPWVAGILIGISFLYFAAGTALNQRRKATQEGIDPFALALYAPGYVLSAVALAVASSEKTLALGVYSSAVLLYALSAWVLREPIFLYPAAWLAAVPYYIGLTFTALPGEWYGLAWLPLIVVYLVLARRVFQKAPLGIKDLRSFVQALEKPAMPFYTLAYGLSVSMMILSRGDALILSLAFIAGSALYFASAALFKNYGWLYPALLTTHFAVGALYDLIPIDLPSNYITIPFLLLLWILALVGRRFVQRFPALGETESEKLTFKLLGYDVDFGRVPHIAHLLTPSWAQAFFIFTVGDIFLWQALALDGMDTAIILAVGNVLLLATFAMDWRDSGLSYAALAFLLLGAVFRLSWTDMPTAELFAWLSGLGCVLYLVGLISEQIAVGEVVRLSTLKIWVKPMTWTAILLTALGVIVTLPQVRTYGIAATASLGFAGMLYLAIAYVKRNTRLSYLGLALLEFDWVLILIDQEIKQPQLYAIPAGLYFVLVGYLERGRGRKLFATILEGFGLAVLLITSFIQSIEGAAGFPYFVLLLVEGVIVIWWGAMQRRKVPFFMGIGASVLDVVSQVILLVNIYDVQRWIIILGVGLILVSAAVFVERKREQIIAQTQEWLEALETWE
jgi:hypothetical protein